MKTPPRLAAAAAAVIDWLGQRVQPRTLTERQTDAAGLASLHRTWGDHPVHGLTPTRLAALLESAEAGDLTDQSALFLDMRDHDPHLDAEMGKRERAILTLPWSIEPPVGASATERRQAKQLAELVAAIPDLEDTILGLMDAAGHGFSAQEIAWSPPADGPRLPQRIEPRPQGWFQLDPATRTELRLRDGSANGADLWPLGWIVHRHAARAGYLWRSGLYRVLAWPWIMRQFSLRDMAEWLEIYGLPMRLGYYPSGAGTDEKATLYRAVRDLGRHAAGIMPDGMRIDLVAAAQGQSDPFLSMVNYCDAVMSKAILGGTLSSTPGATGLGSGVADLQGEVRRDLLVSDARQLQGTLTRQLLWPIAALNGLAGDPRRGPRWTFQTQEPTDLGAFSESLLKLVQAGAGASIPLAWVREQTGIPEPAAGEPTLAPPAPAPVSPVPGQPAALAALATPREPPATDYADQHTERLAVAAQVSVDGWLASLRADLDQAIAAGTPLDDFAAGLLTRYPDLPAGDLTAVLGTALAAADAAGRYDLEQGQ